MFPNPQDALPLPAHPSLEHYRKLAKDLVKACKSGEPDAVGRLAERWIASLFGASRAPRTEHRDREIRRAAGEVEAFAVRKLAAGARTCVLADAQFVIARAHGFDSWPKFAAHVEALVHAGGDTAAFEAAADAIVMGEEATLRRLLHAKPGLVHARSTREHRATLLHYVSANGVENYRQKTPRSITEIAKVLLDAGAEVDAEADVYGGGCTTLGLVATSVHPRSAGLQIALMQLLIDRGALIERRGLAGNGHGAVMGCLANNCPEAAAYLADCGARLGLEEAAGLGRLEVVKASFDERGGLKPGISAERVHTAFRYACFYGRTEVAAWLLQRGVDPAGCDGDGQTGLHHAVIGAKVETVQLLLGRHSPLEAVNAYGGTVLGQALWSAAHGGDTDAYVAIIEALIGAGGSVPERHPPVNERVDALLARHHSVADAGLRWYGERPRTIGG